MTNEALKELIRISNLVGKDSALIQGTGGNTSVKTFDGKSMYIKASGTALKDMSIKRGWRRVRLDSVWEITNDPELRKMDPNNREIKIIKRLYAACDDNITSSAKPSIESHIHAFLDKCVIHLHPMAVIAYTNSKEGKKRIEKIFKANGLFFLWVKYASPGYNLDKKVSEVVGDYMDRYGQKPSIVFLEKHGLIVSSSCAQSALRLTRKVIRLCYLNLERQRKKQIKRPSLKTVKQIKRTIGKAAYEVFGYNEIVGFALNGMIACFMAKKNPAKLLRLPLSLDEFLYVNGPAMWLQQVDFKDIVNKLKTQLKNGQRPSRVLLVKGIGLFVRGDEKSIKMVKDIALSSLFIRHHADCMGGVTGLNKAEQDFISNWQGYALGAAGDLASDKDR